MADGFSDALVEGVVVTALIGGIVKIVTAFGDAYRDPDGAPRGDDERYLCGDDDALHLNDQ